MKFGVALLTTSPLHSRKLVENASYLSSKLSENGIKLLGIRRRDRLCILHMEIEHNPIPITLIITLIAALGIGIIAYLIIGKLPEIGGDIAKTIALYGPPIAVIAASLFVAFMIQKTI